MAWKATGQPTVRKQRDKWVVRVDGIDTATGRHRPRQLGTYPSQRSAQAAARSAKAEDHTSERGTVSWLVRRWVASKTSITLKSREQYDWAAGHIEAGIGAIPLVVRRGFSEDGSSSFDLGHDVVDGLGPHERLGVVVPV